MIAKEVSVKNSSGLHARPATLLVKTASSFKSDVSIEYNGKKANVKSLIGVLSLAVTKDAVIKVVASGDDEGAAVEAIATLIENLED